MLFLGRATSSLGGLIAVLALVTVACTAALIHVEDNHGLAAAGILGSGLIVAIFILIGAVKGRWGVIAALVAAAAQVPGWLDLAVDTDDRKAAAIAGLVCMLGIVVLAAVATLLASSATADGYRRGPEHAVVSAAVQPMVQPHAIPAGGLETRLGPILMPVDPVVQSRGTPPPPISAGPVSRKAAGGTATVVSVAGSPGTPAAQWAADPYGRFQVRYFDGTAWTHHVASDGVTGSDPAV